MQTEKYSEFSGHLHGRQMGKRAPVEVSIEVTRRCPLECRHCYNNLPMADQQARASELTFEEHIRLLDELVKAGCFWILYTGGEIFARKDFLAIYTEAKKRGFLITLFTNGTMINERVANYLADYRPFSIEITLYGATRETYEALTQVPGSYDRCMKGIRLLLERGLPLKLKTVPTTINRHEVYEMKRMAEEDFGCEFKFDPLVNPRIDCSQAPLAVRLSPEEVVTLDFQDAQRRDEWRRIGAMEASAPKPERPETRRYTCGGGMYGCSIDPAGKMSICVLSHKQGYSVREGGFLEGWNGRMLEIRNQQRQRPTICDSCRIRSLCSMCAANGELESGDPESPVDFLCQVAHLRAYALGIDPPEHGDCSCCSGGSQYRALKSAAERIRVQKFPAVTPVPHAPAALNVLQPAEGCHSGGCGSCREHR
ncbi:MAG TPA: radical SAM protein [Candidatus Aquilonibacter sp.]|nr:radical SAM protein [Candidatus Aquilonibacter sp.]